MARKFYFLTLLVWPLSVIAQSYYGHVCDDGGEELSGVSVVLQTSGGSVVSFSRSHADGSFRLSVPEGKYADSISFSMMGFKKMVYGIKEYRNGQVVKMSEEVTAIREVVVRPDRIRAEGDTLNYLVSVFRQKQDRSIADVIAKMPGLSVKEDGSIEYQGQKINRFYVEGMDLMGGKYVQISENLSPDMIKTVQVMENHQPVNVLKNVEFSQQAAINLVLKDDAKNVWSGIAELASGTGLQGSTDWLRDVRLMEMVFGRKLQSLSMYKTNNTGKDIQREIQDLASMESGAPTESGILRNISLGAASVGAQRSRFNDTHVVATNWLLKASSEDDLRLQFSWLYDKSRQTQTRETVYLDADSSVIVDDTQGQSRRNEWRGELNYRANRNNFYLNNDFKGYVDFNDSEGSSLLNGQLCRKEVTPRKRYLLDNFKMIRKNQGNNSYSVASEFSYTYLPGKLLLADNSIQSLNISQLFWDVYGYYEQEWKSVHLRGKAGAKMRNQQLEQGTKDTYEEYQVYAQPSASVSGAAWKLDVSTRISTIFRKYKDRCDTRLVLMPNLFASYKLTPTLEASVSYNYSWHPTDIKTISELPVYVSQTQMLQGTGNMEQTMTHLASASLSYRNAATGWFSRIEFSYLTNMEEIIYQSFVQQNVYVRTATDYRRNRHVASLNGNLGKSFFWSSLSVTLNGSYSVGDYYLLMKDVPGKQKNRNGNVHLEMSLRPFPWLSVEGVSGCSFSQLVNVDDYWSFGHQLKLYITPGNWQIGWISNYYHSNDQSVSAAVFSDVQLSYHTNSIEVALECANIFGTKSFERRYMTNNMKIHTYNILRQREVLARVIFNI